MDRNPQPGEIVMVDGRASVQFAGARAMLFRVIRVDERATYDGWVWLTGYQLTVTGEAVERRDIFVQRAGLRLSPRQSRMR